MKAALAGLLFLTGCATVVEMPSLEGLEVVHIDYLACTQPFAPEMLRIILNEPGSDPINGERVVIFQMVEQDGGLKPADEPFLVIVFERDSPAGEGFIEAVVRTPAGLTRYGTLDALKAAYPTPCHILPTLDRKPA